jgi:hypothetical protein
MTYTGATLSDQLDLRFLQVHRVCEDRVGTEQAMCIIHPSISLALREQILGECDLGGILGYVRLDMQVGILRSEVA